MSERKILFKISSKFKKKKKKKKSTILPYVKNVCGLNPYFIFLFFSLFIGIIAAFSAEMNTFISWLIINFINENQDVCYEKKSLLLRSEGKNTYSLHFHLDKSIFV